MKRTLSRFWGAAKRVDQWLAATPLTSSACALALVACSFMAEDCGRSALGILCLAGAIVVFVKAKRRLQVHASRKEAVKFQFAPVPDGADGGQPNTGWASAVSNPRTDRIRRN